MVTYIERAGAIIDALVDGTATPAQKTKIADSFVYAFREQIVTLGFDPDTLTNDQKSRAFVVFLKKYIRDFVETFDPAKMSAVENVTTVTDAVRDQLDAEFPLEDFE